MHKKTLIGVIVAIVAILLFLFKDKLFALVGANPLSGESGGGTTPTNANTATAASGFLIKKGSRGDKVKFLQAYMNENHNEKLVVDGIWGANTQAAFARLVVKVPAFGSANGLTADEYKFIAPHEAWLREKYFTRK